MYQCTNWPKLYCNLLTLQNISCSDWSWNLHITMHNRVFRGSKLHLMRMGNIKCKNNADFFPSILHNGVFFYWSSMSVCMLLLFFNNKKIEKMSREVSWKHHKYATSAIISLHYGLGWDLNRMSIVASIQGEGLFLISGIPGSPLGIVELSIFKIIFHRKQSKLQYCAICLPK